MEFVIRQTVYLARENSVLHYVQPLEYGDACAHRWMVTINTDGAEADLGAMSAKCYVTRAASDAERAQGVTSVTVILDAEIDAQTSTVSCVFDKACYGSMGAAAAIMRLSDAAGATVTAAKLTARLDRSTSDAVCDPKGLIPSMDELLAQLEAMYAGTKAAQDAAGAANTATGKANTAATNANNAVSKIDNMTVSAASGESAGAAISEKNGAKHIAFTLPKGDPGNTPYIGENGNWWVGDEDTGTKAQGPAGQNGTGSGTVTAVKVGSTTHDPDEAGVVDLGNISGGADLSNDAPKPLGTASAGSSNQAARADHVHKMPTASDVGALAAQGTAADSSKLGGRTWAERLLEIYPIGSIYMSEGSASPASLFGGTWEQLQDRFLLAAGSTYGAGSTGGEATHTLTENEMPTHKHRGITIAGNKLTCWSDSGSGGVFDMSSLFNGSGYNNNDFFAEPVGGGSAHNNMPPYLAVYMWKRVS